MRPRASFPLPRASRSHWMKNRLHRTRRVPPKTTINRHRTRQTTNRPGQVRQGSRTRRRTDRLQNNRQKRKRHTQQVEGKGETMQATVKLLLVVLILMAAAFGADQVAFAQSEEDGEATVVDTEAAEEDAMSKGDLSFQIIFNHAGVFRYVLALILFLGLVFGLMQWMRLFNENKKASPFVQSRLDRDGHDNLRETLKKHAGNSKLGHMLGMMYALAMEGKEDFTGEIEQNIATRKEQFGTFKNWMTFFSDSAGALGLLGTVMGMYATFWGGNLDSAAIISGMGMALSTTLLGIVISLLINLMTTWLNGFFDRQLDTMYKKAEELRLGLRRMGTKTVEQPA
ncbi:hypothetical protein GF324_06140 [bacterium]|nr:hypothetical protein [bacterium]